MYNSKYAFVIHFICKWIRGWDVIICAYVVLQSGVQNGRSRRRVHGTDGSVGVLFSAPVQDGCQLKKATLLTRRRQLDILKQRDGAISAPDLSQRPHLQNGELADSSFG